VETAAKQIIVTGETKVLVGVRDRERERIKRAKFILRTKWSQRQPVLFVLLEPGN
jgi:hypothetical protein